MSQAVIKDWKALPPGKAKYQLYLASREWAVIKEQVRKRSGGRCERCRHADAEQVHHQTYERIYRELIDDLLHVCRQCHEFVSGKRDRDPKLDVPILLEGREVRTVYLAGRISGNRWRDEICPGWSSEVGCAGDDLHDHLSRSLDCDDRPCPLPDGRELYAAGPFWVHQGEHKGSFSWADANHAASSSEPYTCNFAYGIEETYKLRLLVRRVCFGQIQLSDVVFAWIDSAECYGTLVEIGFAEGAGVPCFVFFKAGLDLDELWFARPHIVYRDGWTVCEDVTEAWGKMFKRFNEREDD